MELFDQPVATNLISFSLPFDLDRLSDIKLPVVKLTDRAARNTLIFCYGMILGAMLAATPAAADSSAYHWKDSAGRDHYGSNPPKTATDVQSLAGKSFSRYSSEKVLKSYQRANLSSDAKLTEEFNSKVKPAPSTAKGNQARAIQADPLVTEENLIPELMQGDLTVRHDAQKRISDCSVVVQNKAAIPAENVLVSFEFEDGTLVPGVGPESIDSDSSAKYSIPEEMLPIAIKLKNPNDPAGPKPIVSIKAGGQ